jgi:hypothetical protein
MAEKSFFKTGEHTSEYNDCAMADGRLNEVIEKIAQSAVGHRYVAQSWWSWRESNCNIKKS